MRRSSVVKLTRLWPIILLVWCAPAFAIDDADKAAVRELSSEAKRDYDEGRFDDAALKFQNAYNVAHVPTLAVWTARSLVMRKQLVSASEMYRQVAQLAPNELWIGNAQQEAQTDAARELAALLPRIPRIRIQLEGAAPTEVEITINGVRLASALVNVERLVDPGHVAIVARRGVEVVERAVELNETEHADVHLAFGSSQMSAKPALPVSQTLANPLPRPDTANSATSAQQTIGWITTGVGAAGLLTGTITGILVASKHSSLGCSNNVCDPNKVSGNQVNSYNSLRTISTLGFVIGGIGAAAGVTLLLTSPKHEDSARVGLWLGPGSLAARGSF